MKLLLIIIFIALLTILTILIIVFNDRNDNGTRGGRDTPGDAPDGGGTVNYAVLHDFTNALVLVCVLAGLAAIVGLSLFPPEIIYLQKPSVGVFLLCVGLGLVFSQLGHRLPLSTDTLPHSNRIILIIIALLWAAGVTWEALAHQHLSQSIWSQYCYWLRLAGGVFAVLLPTLMIIQYYRPQWMMGQNGWWLKMGLGAFGILYVVWACGCGMLLFDLAAQ